MSSEILDRLSARNDRSDEGLIEPPDDSVFESINSTRQGSGNTGDPTEYNVTDREEKGTSNGVPQAVGFWHPKMGNVRSHVLKLWFRTGTETIQTPALAISIAPQMNDTYSDVFYQL